MIDDVGTFVHKKKHADGSETLVQTATSGASGTVDKEKLYQRCSGGDLVFFKDLVPASESGAVHLNDFLSWLSHNEIVDATIGKMMSEAQRFKASDSQANKSLHPSLFVEP